MKNSFYIFVILVLSSANGFCEEWSVPPADHTISGKSSSQLVTWKATVDNLINQKNWLEDIQKIGQEKPRSSPVYDENGQLVQVIFGDGSSIHVTYTNNNNDQVSLITLFSDQNPSLKLVVTPTQDVSTNASPNKIPVKDTDRPISSTVTQTISKESFVSLVASLNKKSSSVSAKEDQASTIDFSKMRQILSDLEQNQKKAFLSYEKNTEVYYTTMAKKLSHEPERQKIDAMVNSAVQRSADSVSNQDHEIRNLHSELFEQVLKPSRQSLSQSLFQSFARFRQELAKFLPGKTTIQVQNDITEIVIVLE